MMSIRSILLPILLLLLLSACTPYVYGIREDVWVTMSEPERLAAIDAYKERQLAIQRANEARAQQQRLELERLRQLREEEDARHQARIEAFYHSEHHYGDLLRVRLQGGTMHINGRSRAFRPVVFTIADGEVRTITVYATNGTAVDLQVAYINGRLYLDGEPTTQASRTARLALSLDWGLGHIYAGVNTRNVVSLANVEIYVEIVDTRHYDLRRAQLPAIVVPREIGRERFDQRRIDTVRPPRLNWPDRREQQLDRREKQLDQRERQMNREQNQLERKEMQLDRKEQLLDRQTPDYRQQPPERHPQAPGYRADVPDYRSGTSLRPEQQEQPEQSRRHEQQQMRDKRPEPERPAVAPQPPAPPVVVPAPAPVAPRTPHQATPPAREAKSVAERVKAKEQKGQAKKSTAVKVEKKPVQVKKTPPGKAAATTETEPETEPQKDQNAEGNGHGNEDKPARNGKQL